MHKKLQIKSYHHNFPVGWVKSLNHTYPLANILLHYYYTEPIILFPLQFALKSLSIFIIYKNYFQQQIMHKPYISIFITFSYTQDRIASVISDPEDPLPDVFHSSNSLKPLLHIGGFCRRSATVQKREWTQSSATKRRHNRGRMPPSATGRQ